MSLLIGSAGLVCGHGGPSQGALRAELEGLAGPGGQGLGALRAGSAGLKGWVCWHGGPGRVELRGQAGAGSDRPGGAVGAGLVGQEQARPGLSSCECTHEWFLEMCVPSELARGIKLTTNLDT